MENDEQFIHKNAYGLLSHAKVRTETERLGGQWRLEEITASFPNNRYIEFYFYLLNDSEQHLIGSATIDRDNCKVSEVELGYR